MVMPEGLVQFVRDHLGQKALDTQADAGRGVWFAVEDDGGTASYVQKANLTKLFGGGSWLDFKDMLKMVEEYDPAVQVVVLFCYDEDLQFLGCFDIIE
jgi:hypothetical protein